MAYTDGTATVGGMITSGAGILQRQAPLMVAYALLNIVQQVVQHLEATARIGGAAGAGMITAVSIIVAYIIKVLLMRELLSREGLMAAGTPLRWGAYLGVVIVAGLGTAFGLILLIVPGVLLLLRWFLAPYFVLARGTDVGDSLDASTEATKGHRGTIFGALLLVGLVFIVLTGALILAAGGFKAYTGVIWYSALGIAGLLLQSVYTAVSAALALGIFATLVDRVNQYDDVFG